MGHSDDWDRHWTEYAASAAANPAQEYRRRLVLDLLGPDAAYGRIVDVGAGTGDLLADLRAVYPRAELLALELSEAGVALCRARVPDAAVVRADLTRTDPPAAEHAGWGTHAVCSEVLEHVDDPVALLANARAYLADGAILAVTVPGGPMSAFDRHLGHRRHYRPGELAAVLRRAGFEVERASGAGFPVFDLYRLAVIARGERLVADAAADGASAGRAAHLAMAAFRGLFRLVPRSSRRGWQTIAAARVPR